MLTSRLDDALTYARQVHAGDVRKGTGVPYLAHLLGVTSLVLEHGGDEDQAVAALLHDTAEDHGGRRRLADVADRFGGRVAAIVAACSDSLGDEGAPKAPWWERKVAFLTAIAGERDDALVVTAADKVHNVRALVADHRRLGPVLWERFNPDAGRAGQLWYHRRLHEELAGRASAELPWTPLVEELDLGVAALWDAAAGEDGGAPAVEADWEAGLAIEWQLAATSRRDVRAS